MRVHFEATFGSLYLRYDLRFVKKKQKTDRKEEHANFILLFCCDLLNSLIERTNQFCTALCISQVATRSARKSKLIFPTTDLAPLFCSLLCVGFFFLFCFLLARALCFAQWLHFKASNIQANAFVAAIICALQVFAVDICSSVANCFRFSQTNTRRSDLSADRRSNCALAASTPASYNSKSARKPICLARARGAFAHARLSRVFRAMQASSARTSRQSSARVAQTSNLQSKQQVLGYATPQQVPQTQNARRATNCSRSKRSCQCTRRQPRKSSNNRTQRRLGANKCSKVIPQLTHHSSTINDSREQIQQAASYQMQDANLTQANSSAAPLYVQNLTVVLTAMHVTVFVVGIVGNFLVCLSVFRNKSLQTVTNTYIVNLAIADFLVILICLPPSLVWDLTLTWYFGQAMCKLVLYLQVSLRYNAQCGLWRCHLSRAPLSRRAELARREQTNLCVSSRRVANRSHSHLSCVLLCFAFVSRILER